MKPRLSPLLALLAILTLGGVGLGALAPRPVGPPAEAPAVILYSRATPALRAALPAERCTAFAVEGFKNPGVRAKTVVVAGHSLPPLYLDQPAETIAAAIGSFQPELVVLDTCFGASSPILEALAAEGGHALVVAPPFRIPLDGYVYEPGFLDEPDPAKRAAMVHTEPSFPLLRWVPESRALAALHRELDGLGAEALRKRLKRVSPPLIKALVPGLRLPEGLILVPMPVERFRRPSP